MSFEFVPISEGLRRQELVVQLADRLRLVDVYSQCLFGRIDGNLQSLGAALDDITRRAAKCGRKIEVLANEKRAVTIYSHPKFPAASQQQTFYKSFLGADFEKEVAERLEREATANNNNKRIEATHVPFDDNAHVKSLFFIHDRGQKVNSSIDHDLY